MKKDVWLTIRSRQQFEGCDEEREVQRPGCTRQVG